MRPAGLARGRWRDHCQVLEGIVSTFRTGLPWRDLPERFGPWQPRHDRQDAAQGLSNGSRRRRLQGEAIAGVVDSRPVWSFTSRRAMGALSACVPVLTDAGAHVPPVDFSISSSTRASRTVGCASPRCLTASPTTRSALATPPGWSQPSMACETRSRSVRGCAAPRRVRASCMNSPHS
ncbi:transposase [Streptomyces lasalocidi]|uniref:Transposase n=1 Tax=Streptomyces lasalocidi TaxID=324833 RepID=A0A4U5WRD9_STRLS|nr:transposase [Streptomyces lasalocidi]